jgi:glycosyltransferase involved in cell wall biosynthesis
MLNYIKCFLFFIFCSHIFADEPAPSHLVSFIIPCFNCEKTVEESIASIYQQDLNCPFEIICTDDGSSDDTKLVLQTCSIKYPHMVAYFHDKNKGGGAARNSCILNSKGDLIFCLDSDNILSPHSVNELIKLIDRTGCDIAVCNEIKNFDPNSGHVRDWAYSSSPESTILDIISFITCNPAYNPANSGNYLFTRKSYDRAGGYPENYGAVDTTAFGLAQLATGSKMALLPNHFYWHRYSEKGYWCREGTNNDGNLHRLLKSYSEVLSEKTNRFLLDDENMRQRSLWGIYSRGSFKPASPIILESLFKAYAYKEEKKYLEAADAFAAAVKYGCKSQKIFLYIEEMKNLSKL